MKWKHEVIESLDDIYQELIKLNKTFREVWFPEEFDEEYRKQIKEGEEREERTIDELEKEISVLINKWYKERKELEKENENKK